MRTTSLYHDIARNGAKYLSYQPLVDNVVAHNAKQSCCSSLVPSLAHTQFNYNIEPDMNAPEFRATCLFHDWLEGQHIPHTHVVNEQPNKQRAIAEKKMGKSKGFPDMLVFLPNGVNVAIEMKRGDLPAYATPEQKRWLETLARHGFKCAICHGENEAILFVRECLQITNAGRNV